MQESFIYKYRINRIPCTYVWKQIKSSLHTWCIECYVCWVWVEKKVYSIHWMRPTPLILFTILQDLFWFWWFWKHIFSPTQNASSLLLSWLHTSTTSISSYSTTSTKDKYGMYLRYTSVLTRLHMPDKIRWEMGLFLTAMWHIWRSYSKQQHVFL